MKSAEFYREQARACRTRRAQSEERSGSDGWRSQWASAVEARKYDALAELADRDGLWDFPALFEGDRRVDAKLIEGRYGLVWLLSDEEADRFGRRFVPYDTSHVEGPRESWHSRSAVQKKLGLHQQLEEAPAYVAMSGGDSPMPYYFRTDEK